MKKILMLVLVLFLVSCSSRSFKKDYDVVDASHEDIPSWIQDPQEWAEDKDEKDFEKFRYYVYTTEPKNSKTTACEISKARANSEVASEITQYIKQTLAVSKQGDPTLKDEQLAEYVEDTLSKEVQSFIVGARVYRTYWEKRKFQKELGAKQDYEGFICSSLVKISKSSLTNAFSLARKKLVNQTNQKEVKENVRQAVESAKKAYL